MHPIDGSDMIDLLMSDSSNNPPPAPKENGVEKPGQVRAVIEETLAQPHIRPYRPEDRISVFRIAADTAFFGGPIEAYLEDRRLFLDAFYRYYTDFEPGSAWVAVAGEEVVGFLTGCLDTNRQQAVLRNKLAPDLLWGVLNRRYRLGKMGWRYVRRLALGMIRDEFPHVDLREYPAHLHINVDRSWRGLGLGKSLMAAYLRQLRQSGVPGVHLFTSSQNTTACLLYQRLGFHLVDTRSTRLWEGLVPEGVENRAYALKLA